MQPLHIALGAGALIALSFAFKGGGGGPPAVPRGTSKGSRLFTGRRTSDLTTFNLVNGEVLETPEQIAAEISRKLKVNYGVGTVALATMLASESGGAPDSIRVALAWTAMNRVKRWKQSLLQVLIPQGRFGIQGESDRQFATSKPPTKRDLDVATKVVMGKAPDPTKGSIFFDHPSAQRAFVARKSEGYDKGDKSPEAIAAKRIASGHKMVTLPGVSPDYLRFWA